MFFFWITTGGDTMFDITSPPIASFIIHKNIGTFDKTKQNKNFEI